MNVNILHMSDCRVLGEDRFKLATRDVHVWFSDLESLAWELDGFWETLSEEERLRGKRFYLPRDRNYFIICRGLLKRLLSGYLGVSAGRVPLRYGQYGKPEVPDGILEKTIRFNTSRSHGVGLFAFARENEVGVDIERVRDIPEINEITERFFASSEKAAFTQIPSSGKTQAFFSLWTRKEACLKAQGKGLSVGLDSFKVPFLPDEEGSVITSTNDSSESCSCSVTDLALPPGYAAALAVMEKQRQPAETPERSASLFQHQKTWSSRPGQSSVALPWEMRRL
jgi:4'-phosphopantetheinyl transferase